MRVLSTPDKNAPVVPWGTKVDVGSPLALRKYFVEGVATSANMNDVGIRMIYEPSQGLVYNGPAVAVTVYAVKAKEVSFAGPTGPSLKITKDTDINFEYVAPQYLDSNKDSDTLDAGEKGYPVAYVRNTTPKIGGKLDLNVALPGQAMKLRVKGPGSIAVAEKAASSISGVEIQLDATSSAGPLPNAVFYFDARTPGSEFNLDWEVKVGSGPWISGGTTKHTLYVTYDSPKTTNRQESTYWIGTKAAAVGFVDSEAAVVAKIWAEFADREVYRLPTSPSQSVGTRLSYWNPLSLDPNVCTPHDWAMIASANGNGQCGAWARWFKAVLGVQGVESSLIEVKSTYANDTGVPSSAPKPSFLVKDWWFVGSGSVSGFGNFKYALSDITDSPLGVAGQNNVNPPGAFENHFIVEYGGGYYDPSYGGSVHAGKNEWENASIDGFLRTVIDGGVSRRLAAKNDVSVQELTFNTVIVP